MKTVVLHLRLQVLQLLEQAESQGGDQAGGQEKHW